MKPSAPNYQEAALPEAVSRKVSLSFVGLFALHLRKNSFRQTSGRLPSVPPMWPKLSEGTRLILLSVVWITAPAGWERRNWPSDLKPFDNSRYSPSLKNIAGVFSVAAKSVNLPSEKHSAGAFLNQVTLDYDLSIFLLPVFRTVTLKRTTLWLGPRVW
jgi:hypothetical protein